MLSNSKPNTLELRKENLPFDPKNFNPKNPKIFCCWKWELRDGKWTKPPINVLTGGYAKPNDRSTWCTLGEAIAYYEDHKDTIAGIGIFPRDGIVGLDLDDAVGEDDALKEWAFPIISKFKPFSYMERSPGGKGIRGLCYGKLPAGRRKMDLSQQNGGKAAIEMYDDSSTHYLTLTGHRLNNKNLEPIQSVVDDIFQEYMVDKSAKPKKSEASTGEILKLKSPDLTDAEIVKIITTSTTKSTQEFNDVLNNKNSGNLTVDFNDDSAVEMYLFGKLYFYTQKQEQIESIIRDSRFFLERNRGEKWDKRDDYLERTFKKVVEGHTGCLYGVDQIPKGFAVILKGQEKDLIFPRDSIQGVAKEFADLYSSHLASPFGFWAINFLTFLGCLITPDVRLNNELRQPSRLYTIDIGKSGESKKSTAIQKTRDFFNSVWSKVTNNTNSLYRVEKGLVTGEGIPFIFVDKRKDADDDNVMRIIRMRTKKTMLVYDEFNLLVSKGSSKESIILTKLSDLYEQAEYEHTTKGQGHVSLPNLHISLVAGATPEMFQMAFKNESIDMGLLNRFFLTFDESYKENYNPKMIEESIIDDLVTKTANIINNFFRWAQANNQYIINVNMLPAAETVWIDWCEKFFAKHHDDACTIRLNTLGMRLMAIMAISEETQKVSVDLISRIIKLLEHQYWVRREHMPIDGGNQVSSMEEKIRRFLKKKPGSTRHAIQNAISSHKYGGIEVFNRAMKGPSGCFLWSFHPPWNLS